ncbi:MAG: inositol monophosphatase family protein [Drouetiella hepatica Uher 2000/2452]|jgi:3'(2'), 5'-bisphosphate nucleotidase|uniref:Inositol monophosphatase family protein n=1 Tax=Drouetiella hepatica Uher 2000/2452 TaxID=904376 RepID=A0A951QCK0_9CYAN|nr:inositol monophosphatase family protein [Drouetiella hepatica Uher 2000/2452]
MHLSADQRQSIQRLIRDCGRQAQQMAAEKFQVYEKGRDDYVTDVDRALDARLTAGFSQLFPQDGIITEENSQSWQVLGQIGSGQIGSGQISLEQSKEQADRRLWLIDPIDGTDDFIQGKPHYSVMVGLLEAGQPIAGWVYAPEFDQLYFGGSDWGLFQQLGDAESIPLIPQSPQPPSDHFCPILMGYKDQRRYGQAITQFIPGVQFDCIGSFGLKVMRVICGQAGLYVYLNGRVKLWDTVGPLALAEAAGLVCCDLEGNPLKFTADAVDPQTLAHDQTIVIGWADYVEALRSPLQQAIAQSKLG